MRQQQQCILSGGVHLRHRLEKRTSQKNLPVPLFPQRYYTSPIASVQHRRTSVLACKKLSLFSTRNLTLSRILLAVILVLSN